LRFECCVQRRTYIIYKTIIINIIETQKSKILRGACCCGVPSMPVAVRALATNQKRKKPPSPWHVAHPRMRESRRGGLNSPRGCT
jgi:hypothetical protein